MKNSEKPIQGFLGERHNTLPQIPPLPHPLPHLLREGRMPHAVCLEGQSAAQQKKVALALAGALLCERQRGGMCGECPACRKVMAGAHADVTVCDPEEDRDVYKKDNLRTLRAEAFRRPVEGAAKLFLLLEAQLIPSEGQNLLLKVVEEPPEDTVFLFACSNRYQLLPTILSRVSTVPLPPLTDEECLLQLQHSAPGHTEEEYARALIRCAGSPDAGAALLGDAAVQKRYTAAEEMMAGLAMGQTYRVLAAAAPMEKERAAYAALLVTLSGMLANDTLCKIYNFPIKSALRCRSCIAPLTELCERNAYLPLVTALLAKRCLHP